MCLIIIRTRIEEEKLLTRFGESYRAYIKRTGRWAAVAPGTVVAVLVRHLGFWSMNGCRVVYAIAGDGSREFGFAYGTLTNHAETGEELFKVALRPGTGEVTYVIRAASRPRALLARLGYPVTRSLQARFRRDSAAAMGRAVAGLEDKRTP